MTKLFYRWALFIFLLLPLFSKAIVIKVDDTGDPVPVLSGGTKTLRQALAAAGPGDTILMDIRGTILLSSQLTINKPVVILGAYPIHSIIDLNGSNRIEFDLPSGININMSGFKIVNTPVIGSPAVFVTVGTRVTMRDCVFENLKSSVSGGAVFVSGDFTALNCSFIGNTSAMDGGAIYISNATNAYIENCTFNANVASGAGGAVYCSGISPISSCTFIDNTSLLSDGHDICMGLSSANMSIRNSIFAKASPSSSQITNPGGGVMGTMGGNIFMFTPVPFTAVSSDQVNVTTGALNLGPAVTDGYGLVYFKPNMSSVAIDKGVNLFLPATDCRRAPRVLYGFSGLVPDVGAVEYSPHRVTNGIPTYSPGSLLYAITNINGSSTPPYYVDFNAGAVTVNLTAGITLTQSDVYIDGYSQNGSMIYGPGVLPKTVTPPNTPFKIAGSATGALLTVQNNSNVKIAGLTFSGMDYGLLFNNGFTHEVFGNVLNLSTIAGISASSITGLKIGGQYHHLRNCIKDQTQDAVNISGCTSIAISGNFIGCEETGNFSAPVQGGVVISGCSSVLIGGDHFRGRGNIISGSVQRAVSLSGGSNNAVLGNYIGLNYRGNAGINNIKNGIDITGTGTNHLVGGVNRDRRNYIGYCDPSNTNSGSGIYVHAFAGTLAIQNNYIGLDTASAPAANGTGIWLLNATGVSIGDNTDAQKRNVIGYNNSNGIRLEGSTTTGNMIGKNFVGIKKNNTGAPNGAQAILLINGAASNLVINNVVSSGTGFQHGIELNTTGSANDIAGNLVGTDTTGMTAVPNYNGILLYGAGSGTVVRSNLLSGNNQNGIHIENTSSAVLYSNTIGLNAPGLAPLSNGKNGVLLLNSNGNTIGSGSGYNVIAGNGESGIRLEGSQSTVITRNYIGTNNALANTLGNLQKGITVLANSSDSRIGTAGTPADSNTIMYNGAEGVYINATNVNVGVHHNRIHNNTGKGISLGPVGALPNDVNDADAAGTYGNAGQNYPELLTAFTCGGSTKIAGTINVDVTGINYKIDFFSIPAGEVDGTGHGEGNHYLGTLDVTPSALVHSFIYTVPATLPAGAIVSATCSKQSGTSYATSEFSDTIKVKLPTVPDASVLANVVCNGESTGSAGVAFTGISPITYQWFNGATAMSGYTLPTASGLAAGSYHAMISDGSGCMFNSDTVNITEPAALAYLLTPVPETCAGDGDGAVQLTLSSGATAPFAVGFYTSATTPVNAYAGVAYGATVNETGLAPGGYYAVVSDASACKDTLTFTIGPSASFVTALFTAPAASCVGTPVSFTSASTGSPAPLGFQWDYGDAGTGTGSTSTHTYSAAGTYPVQLVADNGTCDDTVTVNITINPAPTVNAGPDLELCSTTIVFSTLSGTVTGASSYYWTATEVVSWAPDNLSLTTDAYYSGAAVSAGSMDFILTALQSGCTPVDDTVHVVFTAPHSAFAGVDQTVCAGSPIVLNGTITGSPSAVWSGGGSFSPGATTLTGVTYTPSAAEITAGSANITLTTDVSGACATASDALTVTLLTAPVADAGTDQSVCPGGTVTLNASGSTGTITTYQWDQVSGPFIGSTSSVSVSPTATTQYILTAGNGTCSDADTVTVIVTTPADASFSYPASTFCTNDGIQAATPVTAGGSYSVVSGALVVNAANGDLDPSSATGTFDVIYTLATPCPNADTLSVTIHPLPSVTVTEATADYVMCPEDTLQFNGSPAGGAFTAIAGLNTATGEYVGFFAGAGTHNIVYTYTDGTTGCSASDSKSVLVNASPVVSFSPTLAASYCVSEGPILLTGSPAGGGFYLNGTISVGTTYNYDPAVPGTDSIAYGYIDPFTGCSGFSYQVVTVTTGAATPVLSSSGPYTFCETAPQALTVTNPAIATTWYSDAGLSNVITTGVSCSSALLPAGSATVYVVNQSSGSCASTPLAVPYTHYTFDGVTLGGPYSTCAGTPVEIDMTVPAGITYGWLPQTGLSDTAALHPVVNPTATTTYTVMLYITPVPSCVKYDSVSVEVKPCSLENVTNAFTPDGDGTNDTWIIAGIEQHVNNRVTIFNRWGDRMVDFNGYNNTDVVWDGRYNGILVASGTYYFVIEYLDDGQKAAGWVQINY